MPPTESTSDIRSLDRTSLSARLSEAGEPAYRTQQLWKALHGRGVRQWDDLFDIPRRLREQLAAKFSLNPTTILDSPREDNGTGKLLIQFSDGARVECVFLLHSDHATACLSTQSGCRMGCRFCNTGHMGAGRNLLPHEMEEQFHLLASNFGRKPRNIVFMGMGEPLENLDNTIDATRLLGDVDGADVGFRRITISTVGLTPQILTLAHEEPRLKLALSLGSPFQDEREELMPIARKYPIEPLIDAVFEHERITGRRTTIEYILLAGVNDSKRHSDELLRITSGMDVKINLIRYNPSPGLPFFPTTEETALEFQNQLMSGGRNVMLRQSMGTKIGAACGQLAGGVKE